MVAEWEMAPETDSQNSENIVGFGAYLRAERQRRGYSLQDICQTTKVHLAFLDALENEDIANLPEPIYVKGFIKSYCAIFKLDPAPVIREYRTHIEANADRDVINVEVFKAKSFGERVVRFLMALRRLLTGREGYPMG